MSLSTRRLLLPALALVFAAGCQSWGKKKNCDTCPPPPPPGAPIMTPPPGSTILPPSGAPMGAPPGGTILPPAAPPPGAPAPSFPSGASYPPIASYYGPNLRLGVPDSVVGAPAAPPASPPANRAPLPPAKSAPNVKLLPPEFGSGSAPAGDSAAATTPPVTAPPATPSMPVGIMDFAPAIADRVSAGRKPSLDGLDWLKANGYKGAVQLRRTGESDAADRKQFETRGLAFNSLEVSPANLTWVTVEQFSKLVGDAATQPLFVYDTDGSVSGAMWYLYFRRVEKLSDEAARLRATRLGLQENADGAQREMWLAVQKLLAQP